MDFELVRALTHEVLRTMLLRFTQGQNRGQAAADMQLVNITNQVERSAIQSNHIAAGTDLSNSERSFVTQALWELVVQGVLIPANADGGTQGWLSRGG